MNNIWLRVAFWTVVAMIVVGLAFTLAHFWGPNVAFWTIAGVGCVAVVAGLAMLWRRNRRQYRRLGIMHRVALVTGVLTILIFIPGAIGYGIWGLFTVLGRPVPMHERVVEAARMQRSRASDYDSFIGNGKGQWATREFVRAARYPGRVRPSALEKVQGWPFVLPVAGVALTMLFGMVAMFGSLRRGIQDAIARLGPPRDGAVHVGPAGAAPAAPAAVAPAPAQAGAEAHRNPVWAAVWQEVLFFLRHLPVQLAVEIFGQRFLGHR